VELPRNFCGIPQKKRLLPILKADSFLAFAPLPQGELIFSPFLWNSSEKPQSFLKSIISSKPLLALSLKAYRFCMLFFPLYEPLY